MRARAEDDLLGEGVAARGRLARCKRGYGYCVGSLPDGLGGIVKNLWIAGIPRPARVISSGR